MSYFQDLLDSLHKAQNEFNQYERECRSFAVSLVEGYINFLKAPDNLVTCHSVSLGPISTTKSPETALELQSDTFWHLLVVVHLEENGNPLSPMLVQDFMLKKDEEHFLVKSSEYDELFRFHPENEDFSDFYKSIFNKKNNEIRKSFQDFLNGKYEKLPEYLTE